MQSDNPAARLFAILDEGKKVDANQNCRGVWQNLLNVSSSEQALLISRLGKLMELPQTIISIVEDEFPNQLKTCNHWSAQVNKAFMQQNLNDKWGSFSNHIDAHALNFLSITSELLQTKSPTKLLGDDELSDLREKIDSILNETIESDIDSEIKKYVAKGLSDLLRNIDEYRITGAQPIMDGVEIMFGHAFADENYREYLSNDGLGKKLVDILAAVASSVTIVLGAPQLPEAFSNILKLVQK